MLPAEKCARHDHPGCPSAAPRLNEAGRPRQAEEKMVRDVTASWRSEKVTAPGVYVLRGRVGEHGDLVRVGVAGVRGGEKGLYARLDRHERPWKGKKTAGTHEVQPFVIVQAWKLPDWSKVEFASAEHCIYRAFAVRYTRRAGGFPTPPSTSRSTMRVSIRRSARSTSICRRSMPCGRPQWCRQGSSCSDGTWFTSSMEEWSPCGRTKCPSSLGRSRRNSGSSTRG